MLKFEDTKALFEYSISFIQFKKKIRKAAANRELLENQKKRARKTKKKLNVGYISRKGREEKSHELQASCCIEKTGKTAISTKPCLPA